MSSPIYVPEPKYREIDRANSCMSIIDHGTCKTVHCNNAEYVITGAMGSGGGGDWACIWGAKVVDLSVYNGELIPLKYNAHWDEVRAGNRERAYAGMLLVTKGKRQIVVEGPQVEFRKLEVGKQLTLF